MTEYPSYPATLYWDPAGGTSWTKIAQTQDFEGPGISRNATEVMHRDRGSFYMRFIPGMVDGGEFTTTLVFDPSEVPHGGSGGTSLFESIDQGPCTIPAFKYDYGLCTGTLYWIFDGFVSSYTPAGPVEGVHTVEVTIKVDGEPTVYYT